jgi:hypothetical protein
MKVKAVYVSVWDGSEIRTNCDFDTEKNQVSNIENTKEDIEEFINCDEEFVELPDGSQIRDFEDIDTNRVMIDGHIY